MVYELTKSGKKKNGKKAKTKVGDVPKPNKRTSKRKTKKY